MTTTQRHFGDRYRWSELFDGVPRRLVQDRDFTGTLSSLRVTASLAARRHGVEVIMRRLDERSMFLCRVPDPVGH